MKTRGQLPYLPYPPGMFTSRIINPHNTTGGGGGFVPTDVSGCVVWLDASVGVTTSGSNVTAWADQSGSGNDPSNFTNATLSSSPTRVTITEVGEVGWASDFPNGANRSIFLVVQSTDTQGVFIGHSGIRYTGYCNSGGGGAIDFTVGSPTYYVNGSTFTGTNGDLHTAMMTGSPELFEAINIDLSAASFNDFKLGNRASSTSVYTLTAGILELIVYNSALGSTDRGSVESYLIAKHGIS